MKKYEGLLKKTFGPVMFNWTCMMNNAYAPDSGIQPHVHFHVRPRYDRSVIIGGYSFEDPTFGAYYDRLRKDYIDEELFEKVYNSLIQNL